MLPVAQLITAQNVSSLSVEINWTHRFDTTIEAIGYMLVVEESGPDILHPGVFWQAYNVRPSDIGYITDRFVRVELIH